MEPVIGDLRSIDYLDAVAVARETGHMTGIADPEVLHTPLAGHKQMVVELQQPSVSAGHRLKRGCKKRSLFVVGVDTCREEVAGNHTTRHFDQLRQYRSFLPIRVLEAWCWAGCCQS